MLQVGYRPSLQCGKGRTSTPKTVFSITRCSQFWSFLLSFSCDSILGLNHQLAAFGDSDRPIGQRTAVSSVVGNNFILRFQIVLSHSAMSLHMYDDTTVMEMMSSFRERKSNLGLDFTSFKKVTATEGRDSILNSKDLGMLELTSPELERIILEPLEDKVQMFTTVTNNFQQRAEIKNVPDFVSDFCSGFDQSQKRSTELQNLDHDVFETKHLSSCGSTALGSTECTNSQGNLPAATVNLQHFNSKLTSVGTTNFVPSRPISIIPTAANPGVSYLPSIIQSRLREEPQLVPCSGTTPPLSPINMDSQSRMKQERKRERNRLAARKCRTKKLEQMTRLEIRVKELKDQNRALEEMATALRNKMNRLQVQMTQHFNCDCRLMTMMMTTTSTNTINNGFL